MTTTASASNASEPAVQITGAGSTFDYPFFSKAFYQYTKDHPNITVNYQSIGSGGGIEQFTQNTVDFGASDVPMNAAELQRASDAVIQIPVALGGEVLSYNVAGVPNHIRLTPQVLSAIYLGAIKDWNDRALLQINPGVHFPKVPIVVVHRSDGSGTTYIFTDYLSSISSQWKQTVGAGKSVQWPAQSSVGGKGNEGVAGLVRNTPGAIGYVELAYAVDNHMNSALLQNRDGKWVQCTAATVRAAAATKPQVSASDFSIVNRPGANSYPISGYSWALVYQKPADARHAKIVHDVLSWLVGSQAQAIAGSLGYVPLPGNVQAVAKSALSRMRF
jgi:phosphate transport system substrate-binding protein